MSTIKHPVGPQSSKVYRRRRLVVGLGLVAVVVIVLLIIVRPGASSGDPGRASTAQAGTDAAAPPATGQPGAAPGAEGSSCDPRNVRVEAITDAVSYASDELPQLSVTITNTGEASCSLNAGSSKQVFTITSGEDIYWTSTHCQTDPADAVVLLEPGTPVSSSAPVAWERVRSAPDTCDAAERDAAPAGGASYYLSVSVDGIQSVSPTQFLLY